MKRFMLALFAISILLLAAPTAFAQATRTWVSGVGDDVNPCSRTAPCKTFAGAISKTASGGEIDALDPAGFGAVTITKPITIDGGGGQVASILSSGVNGVIINLPNGAVGTVILRNLRITGAGTTLGTNGVRFLAGTQVVIDHCDISYYSGAGVDVNLTAGTTNGSIVVRNTTISNVATGLSVQTNNGSGLNAFATLNNSSISFATTYGAFTAYGGVINVDNSLFSFNPGYGVFPSGGGIIRLSNNDFFNNGTAAGPGYVTANNNRQTTGVGGSITTF